jgi:hypothetical protein
MDRIAGGISRATSRLMTTAVSLVGNEEAVRKELSCSLPDFRALTAMHKRPTEEQLYTLISIVVREQRILIAKSRELSAEIGARLGKKG